MRERLRSLGARGVQARTFHSAALRQLRFFWPRVHERELPELTESKLGMLALAARRQRLGVDQATLRDLASEIEWAKVSNVSPDTYAAIAAPAGARCPASTRRWWPAPSTPTRRSSAARAGWTWRTCCSSAPASSPTTSAVAAQVRRQYKWFVVDEFQDVSPLQYGAARPVARRSRRAVRRRRPRPDDLLLRRRRRPLPARVHPALPGRHQRRAGPQLPLHPRGRRGRQPAAGRHSQQGGRPRRPAPGRRRGSRAARPPTRSRRPTPSPSAIAALRAAGTPASRMAVLLRINAQSERFEEALAARGIPYVVRGAARFFDRGEVRQAITLVRGAARSGEASGRRRRGGRGGAVADGPLDRAAGGQGRGPQPLGVVAGARRPRDRVRPGATRRRPRRLRRRPRPARRRAARTRRRRASPSPRSTPPRAWSGTPSSSPACTRR